MRALAVVSLAVLGAGCAAGSRSRALTPASPLEVRQAQTRVFETADSRLVVKASINALQDAGYVIRQADAELGLVAAVAEWKSRSPVPGLKTLKWAAAPFTWGASLLVPSGRTEFASVEANVNVTAEGSRTRVRISLVSRVIDADGRVRSVSAVADPLAYQGLLAALDKAVYLEREGL
jgi:hypothetical protein